jgi:hypothetical protein
MGRVYFGGSGRKGETKFYLRPGENFRFKDIALSLPRLDTAPYTVHGATRTEAFYLVISIMCCFELQDMVLETLKEQMGNVPAAIKDAVRASVVVNLLVSVGQ